MLVHEWCGIGKGRVRGRCFQGAQRKQRGNSCIMKNALKSGIKTKLIGVTKARNREFNLNLNCFHDNSLMYLMLGQWIQKLG